MQTLGPGGETEIGIDAGDDDAGLDRQHLEPHQANAHVCVDHQVLLEDQIHEVVKLCGTRRPADMRITVPYHLSRSEEHTSELQSQSNLVCRLLLEKKKEEKITTITSHSNGTE